MPDNENLQPLETSPVQDQEPIVDAETNRELYDPDTMLLQPLDTPADVTPPPRTL